MPAPRILMATSLLLVCCGAALDAGRQAARECVVVKQTCRLQIKQTKVGFKLAGVEFGGGRKLGSLELATDVAQRLTNVAQILDQMQFSRCGQLNRLTTCDNAREDLLRIGFIANEQLGQLALLAQMYSDKPELMKEVLLSWIVQSTEQIGRAYAKAFQAGNAALERSLADAREAQQWALKELGLPDASQVRDPLRR